MSPDRRRSWRVWVLPAESSNRVSANNQRDRQANQEQVANRSSQDEPQIALERGHTVNRRERYDDVVHEQEDQFAIDHAPENGALDQKRELAAGEIEDRRHGERDEEMQDRAKSRSCSATFERFGAEQATGD